jgi:hypothetical protein
VTPEEEDFGSVRKNVLDLQNVAFKALGAVHGLNH